MLSFKDSKQEINDFLFNNSLLNKIFGNILFVSILIVIIIILIIYNLSYYENNIIKIFIYCFISTISILLIHNNIIKNEYFNDRKSKMDNEFSEMMEQNTEKLINEPIKLYKGKGIISEQSIRKEDKNSDIENFLI